MSDDLGQRETSVNRRWHALVLTVLLAVYMASMHYENALLGIFGFLLVLGRAADHAGFQIASAVYLGLPAIFLIAGIAIGRSRVSNWLIGMAQILAGVAVVVGIFDLGLAPMLGGAFGTEATLLVQFVTALSVLCWQLLVFSWARQLRRPEPKPPVHMTSFRWIASVPIVAAIAWSLGSGVATAVQAYSIADGRPYCIATTGAGKTEHLAGGLFSYGEIRGLEELRGVRLYTQKTGYKSTSHWYFNAVLVVGDKEPLEYWNWSVHRMRFERFVEPDRFIRTVKGACRPVDSFLARLPWL